jgi:hypothetical protein
LVQYTKAELLAKIQHYNLELVKAESDLQRLNDQFSAIGGYNRADDIARAPYIENIGRIRAIIADFNQKLRETGG